MKKMITTTIAALMCLGLSSAYAADEMMKKDDMSKDGAMMKKDDMSKDAMGKDMMKKPAKKAMTKEDEMKKDAMGKGEMMKDEMKKEGMGMGKDQMTK